jgi:hypothetical protein
MICRSYGAYRNLDSDNYKDFAPAEHDLRLEDVQKTSSCRFRFLGGFKVLPNVQTPGTNVLASPIAKTMSKLQDAGVPARASAAPAAAPCPLLTGQGINS